MMILKESLYGWGVCDIPMPRAAYDIYSDRRKRKVRLFSPDRRKPVARQSLVSDMSGILIRDVPYRQFFLLSFLSLSCFVFIYMLSRVMPEQSEKDAPKLIDITIKMIEHIKNDEKPHIYENPPIFREKEIEKKSFSEKIVEKAKPKPQVKTKVVEKKKPILIKEEKVTHEKQLPAIAERPGIRKKALKVVRDDVPKAPVFEKPVEPEDAGVTALSFRKRMYGIDPAEKGFAPPETKTSIKQQDDLTETVSKLDRSKRNYSVSRQKQGIGTTDDKAKLFSKQPHHRKVNIYRSKHSQKNYEVGTPDRHTVVSPGKTDAFVTQPDGASIMIPDPNLSRNSYTVNRRKRNASALSDNRSNSKAFTSNQVLDSGEISLPETELIEKRYSFEENIKPPESQGTSKPSSHLHSFTPQKDTLSKGEELNLGLLRRNRSAQKRAKHSEGNFIGARLHKQSSDFSSDITIADIDPSQIISLKEFNVCIDPGEEFRLKTKLATLLDKPARCGVGGIIFFFRYTESAYTIKVDIYNPQGTLAGDRCSVLQLAIECIKNLKE